MAPPSVDPHGQGFILLGLGDTAAAVVAGWRDQIAVGLPLRERLGATADSQMLGWLDEALQAATVGWRFMLAAPQGDLLLLAARARAAGLIEEEIRALAIEDGSARAQCIHCGSAFPISGGPGDEALCPGCGRKLLVHRHLSRNRAALLAFTTEFETAR